MACEQVCDNKAVVQRWIEKGQARDLEATTGLLPCPRGQAVGPNSVRVAGKKWLLWPFLLLATWGRSRQASLGIQRSFWTCWGVKGLLELGHFLPMRHTFQIPVISSNPVLPAWPGAGGGYTPLGC